MKNTIKTLVIMAGLTQGTILMADAYQIDLVSQDQSKYKISGICSNNVPSNLFSCTVTSEKFDGGEFIITPDNGGEPCVLVGLQDQQIDRRFTVKTNQACGAIGLGENKGITQVKGQSIRITPYTLKK